MKSPFPNEINTLSEAIEAYENLDEFMKSNPGNSYERHLSVIERNKKELEKALYEFGDLRTTKKNWVPHFEIKVIQENGFIKITN